jgi:O-antigen ligase
VSWKAVARPVLSQPPRKLVVRFAMLLLCLAAMFMTNSRAGVVLSLLALMLAFTLYFRRDLSSRAGVWIALAAAGAVALLLLQVMGGNVNSRFDLQGVADEGRLATWRATVRMIADHPWFGTGLGTFEWALPAYRTADVSLWGVWNRAHSTPLELAAEVGVPLAAAIAAGWIVVLVVLARAAAVRRAKVAVPLAAFAVALLSLLHSSLDYDLQIPGYAIVACALVGAGLGQSFRQPRPEALAAADPSAGPRPVNVKERPLPRES